MAASSLNRIVAAAAFVVAACTMTTTHGFCSNPRLSRKAFTTERPVPFTSMASSPSPVVVTASKNSEPHPPPSDLTQFAESAYTVASAVSSLRDVGVVVVKYGGNAMTSPELAKGFCEDVATLQKLGLRIVVVHGGGPQISSMLKTMDVESKFAENGMRISSKEVVGVAELVLCGQVNKQIASGVCSAGGLAVGVSGRDAKLLQCEKQVDPTGVDLGFVGSVVSVNTEFLHNLLDAGVTPVIAPIGCGLGDEADVAYNVNADVAAGRVAGELGAARVLFLTDIAGVLDKEMKLFKKLNVEDVKVLIEDETITGGMIPKVSHAVDAIKLGVGGAFITDGRIPHALVNEILAGGKEGLGSGQGGTIVTK